MKVTLVMVQSLNGKITKGTDPDIYSWTSKEDATFFFNLLKQYSLIVMGSATYEAVREKIVLSQDTLRIVLTKNPEKYAQDEVEGQLEFKNLTPSELLTMLKMRKYESLLLVGGGTLNASFLAEGLVDELYLTLEPKIFGSGALVFAQGEFGANLRLLEVTKLNTEGTLLLRYAVVSSSDTVHDE